MPVAGNGREARSLQSLRLRMVRMAEVLRNTKFLRALIFAALGLVECCSVMSPTRAETLLEYHRESDAQAAPTLQSDHAVVPASVNTPPVVAASPPRPTDPRLLAPQSPAVLATPSQPPPGLARKTTSFGLPRIESWTTAATGLAIVVGLFMVCMWLVRRSGPKPTTPLPVDAVAVLGRMPLANRNFAQLIQIGNKLVLVAVTPEGMTPLTEVTDPSEVHRLLGICHRNHKRSTTAEFKQVLQQLSEEPAKGFLGNEASAAYAQTSR